MTQERGAGKEKGSFHFDTFASITSQEEQRADGGIGWKPLLLYPERSRLQTLSSALKAFFMQKFLVWLKLEL